MAEQQITLVYGAGAVGLMGVIADAAKMAPWAQLGLHAKAILTLDVNGYWQPFHSFLRVSVGVGLMKRENLSLILNVDTVDPSLQSYEAPHVDKWLDLDQT